MAVITPKKPNLAGVSPLAYFTAAGGGDSFPANSSAKYLLHYKNGHTSPQNVIIDDPTSQNPGGATQFNPDVTDAVANASELTILISNPLRFMDSSGNINITYSGVTLLTGQIFEIV